MGLDEYKLLKKNLLAVAGIDEIISVNENVIAGLEDSLPNTINDIESIEIELKKAWNESQISQKEAEISRLKAQPEESVEKIKQKMKNEAWIYSITIAGLLLAFPLVMEWPTLSVFDIVGATAMTGAFCGLPVLVYCWPRAGNYGLDIQIRKKGINKLEIKNQKKIRKIQNKIREKSEKAVNKKLSAKKRQLDNSEKRIQKLKKDINELSNEKDELLAEVANLIPFSSEIL